MSSHVEWLRFKDQSTFTHLARNDAAVAFSADAWSKLNSRPATDIRQVVLLGSGPIEPFTIAALPALSNAHITAIDINPDVFALGKRIGESAEIAWAEVAQVSKNPDRPNRDFLDPERIQHGLMVLERLGSKAVLGGEFGAATFRVAPAVGERVTFVQMDALSALQEKTVIGTPDLTGDFFVQVNINRKPEFMEEAYSRRVAQEALRALKPSGLYIIGDTGMNLGLTLGYFPQLTEGLLSGTSIVHAVCREPGKFTTSHYVMATRQHDVFPFASHVDQTDKRIQDVADQNGITVKQDSMTASRQAEAINNGAINLAYIHGQAEGHTWNMDMDNLATMLPNRGNEKTFGILFPPQK